MTLSTTAAIQVQLRRRGADPSMVDARAAAVETHTASQGHATAITAVPLRTTVRYRRPPPATALRTGGTDSIGGRCRERHTSLAIRTGTARRRNSTDHRRTHRRTSCSRTPRSNRRCRGTRSAVHIHPRPSRSCPGGASSIGCRRSPHTGRSSSRSSPVRSRSRSCRTALPAASSSSMGCSLGRTPRDTRCTVCDPLVA